MLCACMLSCGQSLTDSRKEANAGHQEVIRKAGSGHQAHGTQERRGDGVGVGRQDDKGSEVKGEMCRRENH